MATATSSLSITHTVADALNRMVQRRAPWLPVIARDGRLADVVSLSDIVARASFPRDSRGAWLEVGYRAT